MGKPPEAEGRDGPSGGCLAAPGVRLCRAARASPLGSQRSRVGRSSVSHRSSLLLAGVELAGAQGKHLRLISGEHGAGGPGAWPCFRRRRSQGWGPWWPSLPPSEDRRFWRAAYPSSERNGRCLRTVRKLATAQPCRGSWEGPRRGRSVEPGFEFWKLRVTWMPGLGNYLGSHAG